MGIAVALAVLTQGGGCRQPRRTGPAGSRQALTVEVALPECDTGTMHYAERVEIGGGGRRPLVLRTDVEKGVSAPLIDRQIELDATRHLLLGWSSRGGGMQTIHALLVERGPAAFVLRDHLRITTGRGSAGVLVVNRGAEVRIGIPEPPREVHNPEGWRLAFAGRELDLKAMRALPFSGGAHPRGRASSYCPPFGEIGRHVPPTARIAWFAVGRSGFVRPESRPEG